MSLFTIHAYYCCRVCLLFVKEFFKCKFPDIFFWYWLSSRKYVYLCPLYVKFRKWVYSALIVDVFFPFVLFFAAINGESSLPFVCSVSVWNWILHQWTGTSLWSACCTFLRKGGFWKNGNYFHLKYNGKCRFICSIFPQILLPWKNSDPALAELPDL